MPTPEPAGYCAGDVAGERGDRARDARRLSRGETGRRSATDPSPTRSSDTDVFDIRWPEPDASGSLEGSKPVEGWREWLAPGTRWSSSTRFVDAGDRVVALISNQRMRSRPPASKCPCEGRPRSVIRSRARSSTESMLSRHGSPQSRGPVGARRSRRLLSLRDTARAMSQENVEILWRAKRPRTGAIRTPPSR